MRILFLDLDTLRPDHLGCYGYCRNTSPNIDIIAEQGVRFDNYYCSDAPCLPSRAALMTGRFGIHTGVVGHGGTAADMRLEGSPRGFRDRLAHEAVPAFLRRVGFKTVSISPFAERHSAWQFYAGFSEMHNTGKGGGESAEEITPTVLRWIENNAKQDNWFLHINYWDPHTPYRAPMDFGNPFEGEPLPKWITEEVLEKHRGVVGPHTAREIGMYTNRENPRFPRHPGEIKDMNDLRKMIDGYDCGIRYLDSHIGQIFAALDKHGVMEDLAIIISSDHGENIGELGIYGEHATADVTCHIPMIIRWPNAKEGYVDDGLHYNLDLGPTLAELFGRSPIPRWDGQSYAPALMKGEPCGQDFLILSQCAHVCQRSVLFSPLTPLTSPGPPPAPPERKGDKEGRPYEGGSCDENLERFGPWLYMRTYHDGYHLFPDEMLFNLDDDPYEQRNVADANPDVCKDAVYRLNQWHDDMMKSMPYDVDPLWTVIKEGGPLHARGHLRAYCERLEQTDRGWAIPELKRRHPREFE